MKSNFTENIKIIFEYNDRTAKTEVKPYKKMSELIKIAQKLFYTIKHPISFTYQNQDLKQYDPFLIGDHFNQKNTIKIKIVPKIKKRELRITDKPIEENDPKKQLYSCLCGKYYIANYCRQCSKFICNHCKILKEHSTHKIISININNLIESAKNYALTLKKEINANIEISKRYYNKFQSSKFIEASSWKEIIERKYEQFYEKYQSYINKFKVPDDSEDKINDLINEYKNDNIEIDNMINNIKQNTKKLDYKMNLDEFKDFFAHLKEMEKKINDISKNCKMFIKNYELNEKFDLINKRLERILDQALDDRNFIGYNDSEEENNEYESEGKEEDNNNYDSENEHQKHSINESHKDSYYEDKDDNDNNNNNNNNNDYIDDEEFD